MTAAEPPGRRRSSPLHRRYPTIADLRRRARRHVPGFAFEYLDGGAGTDGGIARNWAALDAIELIPRYGKLIAPPEVETELFGRRYAAPVGIAPMGGISLVWPGAEILLAQAAQRARVPYALGAVGGLAVERMAELAPYVFWFQIYRAPKDDFALGFDLARRAHDAGAHVLILTMDVPVRTVRPRETRAGIRSPFRPDLKMIGQMLRHPAWLWGMSRHGMPRLENLRPYVGPNASLNDMLEFAQRSTGGAFLWDEVARFRDRWKRPLVVKGIMHPADAERAIALGVDGIYVSNHGGRQIEGLPAPIDVLPAIARQVGNRATILMDSGVRSGCDVARVLAAGAQIAMAGKAFLWGLAALGAQGPVHVIEILKSELSSTLGQVGAASLAEAAAIERRHNAAYSFPV